MNIMGFFGDDSSEAQAYDQISDGKVHKSEISHELLAGAASFVAAREYAKHCEKNGKPQSHAEAKELLAAFAGAFIDKSHGLDFVDKQKAKHDAHTNASEAVASDF
ncbi:hypothetical protein C8F04DRAFT_1252347 [Mycena alexandri]|uniref:CipC protein n=1 Tax=Mycena alexandri TaxID=1745969 RepID=A0AAD6XE24_9AGAR|nr:hypothetical protein C8F04DRAFT_1252347 [Mycena alexandri]